MGSYFLGRESGGTSPLARNQATAVRNAGRQAEAQTGRAACCARALPIFERALALREALYRVCKSNLEGWTPPPADLAVVNMEAAKASTHQHLEYTGGKFVYGWKNPSEVERTLWSLANFATEFLS